MRRFNNWFRLRKRRAKKVEETPEPSKSNVMQTIWTFLEHTIGWMTGKRAVRERHAAEFIKQVIVLDEKNAFQLRTWFKAAVSTTFLVILIFAGGMIPGYFFLTQYRLEECLLTPSEPDEPEIMMWNKNQYVGTQVKILCANNTHAPIKVLIVCGTDSQWVILVNNGCDCKTDPMFLTNSNLRVWNGLRIQGTEVKYNCSSNTGSSTVMETECSLRRRWEVVNSDHIRKCRCEEDPPALVVKGGFGLWTEHKPREMGTLAIQYCVREANSPVSRAILCMENGTWTVLGEAACECLSNPIPPPSSNIYINQKGSDSHAIGSEIEYHCTKNEKSAINVTYRCQQNRAWAMDTFGGNREERCKKSFFYLPENTFHEGQAICRTIYGGQLFRIQGNKDRDNLRMQLSKQSNCEKNEYFFGAVEDVNFQWTTYKGQPVSHNALKPLWERCYPNNTDEKCVVVTSNMELRTYDCYRQSCFICENPLCPDSPSKGNINLDQPCFFVYDLAPNFFEVDKFCRAQRQTIAVVTDNSTMFHLFKALGMAKLGKCDTAFIGLFVGSRVWNYWDDELARVSFWDENEPTSYGSRCAVVGISSSYQKWKSVDCKTYRACLVCEYTASVGFV